MKRITFLIILGCFFVLTSTNCWADTRHKYLQTKCIPELNFFELSATKIFNIKYENIDIPKNYGLIPESEGQYECDLGQEKITIKHRSSKARTKGQCAVGTRSFIDIFLNETLVAKNIYFHDDCFSAGTIKISFQSIIKDGTIAFEMHPGRSHYGPKQIVSDRVILDLKNNTFHSNMRHDLPITMKYIRDRSKQLQ